METDDIPRLGDTPDRSSLDNYIKWMPAGQWVPAGWADGPQLIVVTHVESPNAAFDCVARAFPPFHGRGRLVFCVPALAAHLLSWYAEDHLYFVEAEFPLPDGFDAALAARLVDAVAEQAGAEEAAITLELIVEMASGAGFGVNAVAEIAVPLIAESDGTVDDPSLVQAAIDTLTR